MASIDMIAFHTCGLLLGGDLHTGAKSAISSLTEGSHLEHIGGAGLEVVDGGRGGLGPDGGVDALLLVLEKKENTYNNGRMSRVVRLPPPDTRKHQVHLIISKA